MSSKAVTAQQWGTFTPHGSDRLLLLARQIGLAHGPVKHYLSRIWFNRHSETPVDTRYHNIKYRLYPWDNTVDQKILFGSRYRDKTELTALTHAIRGGGVFVDIGANTGYYALTAAGAGATRVIAIEPYPPTFERLEFNIKTNRFEDSIHTSQLALGDHRGEAILYVPETGDLGSSRISEQTLAGRPVTVPMMPLAELISEQQVRQIDALKIDVEGMEDSVLFPFFETAQRSLWPRLIIIEHTSGKDWKRDILAWMLENGYEKSSQTRSNMILCLR